MASLRTLSVEDLEGLIAEGHELDMSCDHCRTPYIVRIPELEAVAAQKARGIVEH